MPKQLPKSELSVASLCGLTVVWAGLTWAAGQVLSRILVDLMLKGTPWDD